MKKGSIQVSAGFLVMMILALVAFGLGITFLYNIMGQVEEATGSINEQTKEQIERVLLEPGKKVAFPINNVEISRGEKKILGFGVHNTLQDYKKFEIKTSCEDAYDFEDQPITGSGCDSWVINTQNGRIIEVPKREQKIDNLFIKVPDGAKYGKYIFSLTVKKNPSTCQESDCTYDTSKRFYVTVK